MKFYTARRAAPVVPIVSLIDILAILLIFFIFTTTFKKRESLVNVSLPKSSELPESASADARLTLAVTLDEQIMLGEDIVAIDQLGAELTALKLRSPDVKLEMKADEGVSLGFLVKVWDEASRAEVKIGEIPLRILLKQGDAAR